MGGLSLSDWFGINRDILESCFYGYGVFLFRANTACVRQTQFQDDSNLSYAIFYLLFFPKCIWKLL